MAQPLLRRTVLRHWLCVSFVYSCFKYLIGLLLITALFGFVPRKRRYLLLLKCFSGSFTNVHAEFVYYLVEELSYDTGQCINMYFVLVWIFKCITFSNFVT